MQLQSTQHWGATDTIRVAQDEPSASRGRAAADGLVSSFRIPSSRVRCTPPSKRAALRALLERHQRRRLSDGVERFANLAWHTGHNAGPDALIASTGGDRGSGEGGGTTVLAEQQAAHHLHSVVSPSATRRCMNAKYGPVSSRNCAKHQRA
ncbi:hypothetical protein CGC21_17280 [Leishmania donovani]|uniref:Uncharacterized protein n=1 Tax=Leishmania donovani TaxID=5661 RepID=A0A504XNW1_LEIDO|nr:hypothetical protein CGC21_17280 [Leishmania donovani]